MSTSPIDVSLDDPVALTQALVQIDSSNPTLSTAAGAGEGQIANYVQAWFKHHGIEHHRLETNPGRPSVIGIVRGSGGGKALMFNGHIDTVSLATYGHDPLSGALVDKNGCQAVTGRGSMDMKGGVAAAMTALLVAKKNARLRGDVIVAAVADEEDASRGTQDLISAGWSADVAIIPEPTMHNVGFAHRGFVWVEVDILGVAAHGSEPALGVDAIMHAKYFLDALEAYQKRLPIDKDLGPASLHCGLIEGGEEPSSYPARCTVTVEFRTVSGQTKESILSDIADLLSEITKLHPSFRHERPRATLTRPMHKIPKNHFLAEKVTQVATSILGSSVCRAPQRFWCDAALLSEAGIPAVVFGPIGAGMHSKEEWVDADSIRQVESVFKILISDICA